MSITVTVDTSQVQELASRTGSSLDDMSEGLSQAVQETLIPDLQLLSSTQWGVVTGAYSEGWVIASAAGNQVVVENTARAITDGYGYSLSLEYGWTSRGISHEGGFVAQQATENASESIGEALVGWLMSQLPS